MESDWCESIARMYWKGVTIWERMTTLQRIGASAAVATALILGILGLVYNERIFHWLAPWAKRWRELPGGWAILWAMVFTVSFPPLIGYSTCITTAGFVFGFLKGWAIVATATVVGSTCAFAASRTVLKPVVRRWTEENRRFAALSLVLKHDGLKLLTMIRLCPLPYSLGNGAISTIPTVTWWNFALATAMSTPRLLIYTFVGGRLGDLGEKGEKMDWKSRGVSYAGVVIGLVMGTTVGYIIYQRTKARAAELEEEVLVEEGEDEFALNSENGDGDYHDSDDGWDV
ncbi:hypothetical protein K470DRAFT_223603 [Piedraia hortae CBS 480.64]|uniref:Golgi apparatus membrane protein TVP38 n=1 Tax=Piedraia hortae CBS 480.64 TaxID=1314780 RepID=A0A6A7BQA0_9PEZI|nr:hypothetical protein K470DRAFT_223603 [Piedraia hortae CBS 480.64]